MFNNYDKVILYKEYLVITLRNAPKSTMFISFQQSYPHSKFVENVEKSLKGILKPNKMVENSKSAKFLV